MRTHSIRVFVNKKNLVETSPYSSLYSFRGEVKEKLYPDLDTTVALQMYHKGKRLTEDSDSCSLYKLGITNDSSVTITPSMEGGNATSGLMWIVYYIGLILYLIFLISGFLPVFANAFAYTINDTIFALLDKFTTNKESTFIKFTRLIIRFISWVIRNLATLLFVWAITGYIMFPWLYGKANKFCESALAAKRIGWWTMFIFMLIYGALNLVDAMINISQSLIMEFPQLFDATLSPTLQGFKEAWDELKFTPLYLIPGLLPYHEIVEEMILALYDSTAIVGALDCNSEEQAEGLCNLFEGLNKVSLASSKAKHEKEEHGGKKGHSEHSEHRRHKGGSGYHNQWGGKGHPHHSKPKGHQNRDKAKERHKQGSENQGKQMNIQSGVQDFLQKRANRAAGKAGNATGLVSQEQITNHGEGLLGDIAMAPMKEFIDNYRLGPGLELVTVGTCDKADKIAGRLPAADPTGDGRFLIGSFNRWSAGFFTSLFCEIVEAIDDMNNTLYGIGTDDQVVNMVKTGNFAGLFAGLYVIIMLIYTVFASSFAGYDYN